MILDYADDTAIFYLPTGSNKKGVQQFGSGVPAKVRFEQFEKIVTDEGGNSVTLAGKIFAPPSVSVRSGSKVTIDSVDYKVFNASPKKADGDFYWIITVEQMKGAG